MITEYDVKEKDGRTLIFPLMDKQDLEYVGKQTKDDNVFQFFMEGLTPAYFTNSPVIDAAFHGCNHQIRKHTNSMGSMNVLEMHLNLVDEYGNRIPETPKIGVGNARGIALSSSIQQANDLNYDKGILKDYKTFPLFNQIENAGVSGQEVYENIVTAIMHGTSFDGVNARYDGKTKPFSVPKDKNIKFYFFNPSKERLSFASNEFNLFISYLKKNKSEIMDVAAFRITAQSINKLDYNRKSYHGRVINDTANKFMDESDKLLNSLASKENFSGLESLVYKTPPSDGWKW